MCSLQKDNALTWVQAPYLTMANAMHPKKYDTYAQNEQVYVEVETMMLMNSKILSSFMYSKE